MYVYKFIEKEEIIYIGITKNIHSRILQHKRSGKFYIFADNIEYTALPNKTTAELFEKYLINKYSPKYNTVYNRNDSLEMVSFKKMEWMKYEKDILKDKNNISNKRIVNKITLSKKDISSNKNTLHFIKNNMKNLINIYYDKHQHLCLLFNNQACLEYKTLKKNKSELIYYVNYINILTGIICPVDINEHSTIELSFLDLYKTDNIEYKNAIRNIYELINYNSLNLDISQGINIEKNRILNIYNTFNNWIINKKSLQTINLLNNQIIEFNINFLLEDLLNIYHYGNGYYELKYKKTTLKIYYDDFSYEIGNYYKNIEERNISLKFKNQLLIFKSQKYFHYFWFIMTENKIPILEGTNGKKYLSSNSFINSNFSLRNE